MDATLTATTAASTHIDPLAFYALRAVLQGQLYTPEDSEYEALRKPWQLHVDQYPAAIVMAASAADVVAAVDFAREQELPVAVQGTGHGAVVPANGGVLINTSAMQGVTIDAGKQTARVEAGVKWGKVLTPAQDAGLAPLIGSTTDVGVMGYSLGGGMGWLGRKYGLAVDSILSLEIVTPDGELRHASPESNPDLFWGVRGGAGNFGVVTSMEIQLYPVTEVYAGNIYFPISMAREVTAAYSQWIETLSDDWSTGIVLMHIPPLPFIPEPLRGQSVVIVRGAYSGDNFARAEQELKPIRDLGGMIADMFGPMPFRAADSISQDPVDPTVGLGRTETLTELTPATFETLREILGEPGQSPVLVAEIRQMGGAVSRAPQHASAFGHRDLKFVLLLLAPVFDPAQEPATQGYLKAAATLLEPHKTGQVYLNFLHDSDINAERVRAGWTPATYERLVALKNTYDPTNMLRFNRNIKPSKEV